jgi:hypothetical protein
MLRWNRVAWVCEAGGRAEGRAGRAAGTYQSKLMIVRSAERGKIVCRFLGGLRLKHFRERDDPFADLESERLMRGRESGFTMTAFRFSDLRRRRWQPTGGTIRVSRTEST